MINKLKESDILQNIKAVFPKNNPSINSMLLDTYGDSALSPGLDSKIIDLSNFSLSQGFIMTNYESAGLSINSFGDFNGDGYKDILIGAPYAYANGISDAGETYIIYGSSDNPGNIDLSNITNIGFTIYGTVRREHSGISVSSAGDFNGDGYDDIIIGASTEGTGGAYIIYGASNHEDMYLNNLENKGFYVAGNPLIDRYLGSAVSSAGDINNDGYDDIIVASENSSPSSKHYAGISYVIYGRASNPVNIDLSTLSNQEFAVFGAAEDDNSGSSVSSAGDFNGDGYDDIIIGASSAERYAGASYVIYGKLSKHGNIDLANLGSKGFVIHGASSYSASGISVSSGGDINKDGYDDVIIGALNSFTNSASQAGKTYVVYGSFIFSDVYLSNLSNRGFVINGPLGYGHSGQFVSGNNDFNGDGYNGKCTL